MNAPTLDAPALPRWIARDFPFRRRTVELGDYRVHVVDEPAPISTDLSIVLFHGNPTWSYLWRKVIAQLIERRVPARIIAPDLLGCGLSDKLARSGEHRLTRHIDVMRRTLDALGVERAVVCGQDWGGPIGMGVAKSLDARGALAGLVLANTAVVTPARPMRPTSFHRFARRPIVSDLAFRLFLFPVPVMHMTQGARESLGLRERAVYAWPFRRLRDRATALGLARMVPDREDHPSMATLDEIGAWIESYRGPVELVWGERDPILGRSLARHERALPQARVTRTQAGHFLQEEVPGELADAIGRIVATLSR